MLRSLLAPSRAVWPATATLVLIAFGPAVARHQGQELARPARELVRRARGWQQHFVSPDHDLVVVWRWHSGRNNADASFFRMLVDAIVK